MALNIEISFFAYRAQFLRGRGKSKELLSLRGSSLKESKEGMRYFPTLREGYSRKPKEMEESSSGKEISGGEKKGFIPKFSGGKASRLAKGLRRASGCLKCLRRGKE